jgi:hypothetical protein
VPDKRDPDLSLFLDILQTLNRIGAPYVDERVKRQGKEAIDLWQTIKASAQQ